MVRVYPATLTLTDEYDTITIRPATVSPLDPVVCSSWDLGAPEPRVASTPRGGADGDIDRTEFVGPRAVTLSLIVRGDANNVTDGQSAYRYADRLTAMTLPARRPTLQVSRNNPEAFGEIWEMVVRGNPFSITYGRRAAAMLELQLAFTAPLGLLQGPLRGVDSNTVAVGGGAGNLTLPITLPISLTDGSAATPTLFLDIGGAAPISPTIYIWGPADNPEVFTDIGERFTFTNLTLVEGQFVAIDMNEGTVLLGGSPSASVYHLVDFDVSTFWRWMPGPHTVRLVATGGKFSVHWRERRLLV